MTREYKKIRKRRRQPQALALFLMGGGLVVFGLLAFFLFSDRNNIPASASNGEGSGSAVPVAVNYPAPELTLTDLDKNEVSLADYNGQVILINNWATWCPPCKAEMPTLQAYYEEKRAQGFVIIAIEAGEPLGEVRQFVEDYGLTFPVWPDLGQKALRVFRNTGLPNSYVIDRTGNVRLVWNGAISYEMLDKYVTPLIEE